MNNNSLHENKNELDVRIDYKTFKGSKSEPNLIVIKDMNFKVKAGQFCCLLGPSGCGKTTLLNILSGLDSNFDGNIQLDNRECIAVSYPEFDTTIKEIVQ